MFSIYLVHTKFIKGYQYNISKQNNAVVVMANMYIYLIENKSEIYPDTH